VGKAAKIPMEPVSVVGSAHISSPPVATQYPPEAATELIEITTGFPAPRVRASSRRMISDATALPPPLYIRSTKDLIRSSCRARRMSLPSDSAPIRPAG